MAESSNEEVVLAYIAAHTRADYDAVGALRHPDWVTEWPQSGERIRGDENDRLIMANWPGGPPRAGTIRVVGSEDRWLVTPGFTLQRVVGSGDVWWANGTARHPDGSTWYLSALFELRDHRIYRETWYFAPPVEAPAWRSPWVERMR
jgi:hypothetical protein